MQYKRSERVASLIQEEVSKMLVHELRDPNLAMVTITKVRLTDDLRDAKIYYSVLGDDDRKQEVSEALDRAKGRIRSELGRRIKLRFVPTIRFFYDDTTEYANHIESLLKKINDEKKQ